MPFVALGSDVGASADGNFVTLLDLEVPSGTYQATFAITGATDTGFTLGPARVIDTDTGDTLGELVTGFSPRPSDPAGFFGRAAFSGPVIVTAPTMLVRLRIAASEQEGDPVTGLTYFANSRDGAPFATYLQMVSDTDSSIGLVLESVRQVYVNPWESP